MSLNKFERNTCFTGILNRLNPNWPQGIQNYSKIFKFVMETVYSLQLAVYSWQLAAGSWQLATCNL